jgi:hypothetical protein
VRKEEHMVAGALTARNGSAAEGEIIALQTWSDSYRGRGFGDDVLMSRVEERDEAASGAGLEST